MGALMSGLGGAASGAAVGSVAGPIGTVIGGIGGGIYGLLSGASSDSDKEEAAKRAQALGDSVSAQSGFASGDPAAQQYFADLYHRGDMAQGRNAGLHGMTPYTSDRDRELDALNAQRGGLANYQFALDRGQYGMQHAGQVGSLSDVLARQNEARSRNQAASMMANARGGGASSALAGWQAGQMAGDASANANIQRMSGAFQEQQQAQGLYTQAMHGNQNALNAIQQSAAGMGNQSLSAQGQDDAKEEYYRSLANQAMQNDRGMRYQTATERANIMLGRQDAAQQQSNWQAGQNRQTVQDVGMAVATNEKRDAMLKAEQDKKNASDPGF